MKREFIQLLGNEEIERIQKMLSMVAEDRIHCFLEMPLMTPKFTPEGLCAGLLAEKINAVCNLIEYREKAFDPEIRSTLSKHLADAMDYIVLLTILNRRVETTAPKIEKGDDINEHADI